MFFIIYLPLSSEKPAHNLLVARNSADSAVLIAAVEIGTRLYVEYGNAIDIFVRQTFFAIQRNEAIISGGYPRRAVVFVRFADYEINGRFGVYERFEFAVKSSGSIVKTSESVSPPPE